MFLIIEKKSISLKILKSLSWVGKTKYFYPSALEQWFSTEVPRHTRVPWDSVKGAATYPLYWPLELF